MMWFDQGTFQDLLRDIDKDFSLTKIINFDIIHRESRGEVVPKELLRQYQTVNEKQVCQYPVDHQQKILSSAFRRDREDIYFEKERLKNIFLKKFLVKIRL